MIQSNLLNKKACLFSILSLFATMYSYSDLKDISFSDFFLNIFVEALLGIFLAIIYYLFYNYVIQKVCKFSTLSMFIGIFAGIINVLGRNFVLHNSMQFFSKSIFFSVVFSSLAAIGYGLIYASVFELGWSYLNDQREKSVKSENKYSYLSAINCIVFDKRPLLYPFLLICLFWLPYLISFFPGMLQWDASVALSGYYGTGIWNNHHPVIGALMMGYIMDVGKFLGNDNYGCAIYVILQFLLLSITLAYQFVFFNKWKTNYCIRWFVLLIFSLHPVFPTFVMNEVKDIFYCVAYLWLLFLFIKCFDEYNTPLAFYIIIASMFVCALRKEGIIVSIICSVVLLISRETVYENWKSILNAIILGSIFATILSYGALVCYNVDKSYITEALSIPVQQTARYIRGYSVDITESEWEILNSIFKNKAKTLGSYYEPDISDPVKGKIDNQVFKEQKAAYFKVWRSHFFRHPGCYFSAAFNQMYGYFYAGKESMYKIGDCRTENFVKGDSFYNEQFIIVDDQRTISLRNAMKKYVYSWPELPVLGLLYHPAVYTWILFFGLSCLIHFKKYKYLFLYCMPLVVLCICCLSPANAFIRYSYPIIISCFILSAYNLRLVS